jgi:hypothetical protein
MDIYLQLKAFDRPSPLSEALISAILPKHWWEEGVTMIRTGMPNRLGHLVAGLVVMLAASLWATSPSMAADCASKTPVQLAQWGGPPPPGFNRGCPPCSAVNNPWGGAARGAAGGAIIGGIAGNAGRGAAIGAGVGLLGRSIRNSNARANGWCC